MTQEQINYQVSQVRVDIRQRSLLYRGNRSLAIVSGKIVIIIDDGLASGFTTMAAVQSVRRRRPKEIVVAIPVASAVALKQVERVADRIVTCATGFMPKFYISDYYRYWHDLKDDEVIRYLRQWRMRHLP